MKRRRALLVFTRSPEAEARAKGFREATAAPLFRAFLESWVSLARETGTALLLATPAPCRRRLERSGVASGATFLTQPRSAFGERVAAAVREASALGFESVVVVGGDAPAIGASELRRAFEEVERGSVALGPAVDGGVSLIAIGARDADLVRPLRLRDPRALVRLLADVAARGRGVALFPTRPEVDSTKDAARLRRFAGIDPGWFAYRFLLERAIRAERPAPDARDRRAPSPAVRRRVTRGPRAA
jgi:glycosyltransferase A (GT-A) superfamily protein (DUF2064 family)